jgi:HEAT repeat protein
MEQGAEERVAYFGGEAAPTEAETRYRRQVERVFNRISLTGLPERDPGLSELPLDQIFISLEIEVRQFSPFEPQAELRDKAERYGFLPTFQGYQRSQVLARFANMYQPAGATVMDYMAAASATPSTPIKLSIGEALHRYRRLVIAGDPGSGKTTLLRWLAVTFAAGRQADPDRLGPSLPKPYLPIVLELRRFAERLRQLAEQPAAFDLTREISNYIAKDARFAGTTQEAIEAAIAAGRCIFLLDGLDEVDDRPARARLIEAIEAIYLDPRSGLSGNLCLLTTRPHGFANLSIGAGFQTATVRPFGRDDVSAFVRNWYRVAYGEHALSDEAAQLEDAIQNNERVEALATNPLLCTIIAVVFRNNRVLPERRVELYFKCCEALLDTWERNKDIRNSGLIGSFGWQLKLELLATLAYWMHSENERLAASGEEIVQRVSEALEADHLATSGHEEDEARRFIEAIRDRSGLLRGRGDGSLEFSHRTFQEYLAARQIAAMDEEAMIDAVMPHLHQAWWQEVHLLLFGHIGSGKDGARKVERLVQSVLSATAKPLPFLTSPTYPALRVFLPGWWFPAWQLQRRVAQLLGRDLLPAVQGYGQCVPTARPTGLTQRLTREIDILISRLRRGPPYIRGVLAIVIGKAGRYARGGPLGTAAVAALLAALKDGDPSVRWAAAGALQPAAAGDPAVVAPLLAALKDDDPSVRWAAAGALQPAAAGDPAVVAALLAALKDDDTPVRWAAAGALQPAAAGDPAVVAALLAALKDSDYSMRSTAAGALRAAAPDDPAVVAALLAALKDSEPFVRSRAAGALQAAAAGDPAVVAALLKALNDSVPSVRSAAARALQTAVAGNPAVVAPLLAALKDSLPSVRSAAAKALTNSPSVNQKDQKLFRQILAALYRDFEQTGSLYDAIESLDAIERLTGGRQLPGYRWRSLQKRREQKERLRKIAIASGTGCVIGFALYFGGEWYAGLPETSPMKMFLKAIPAVSTLLGLAWGFVLVFRGEKPTLWG